MKRLLYFCFVFSCIVWGCATSGKISKAKNFNITMETPIAVQCPEDTSIAAEIEGELLALGLNIVPYETAVSAIETNVKVAENRNTLSGSSISSRVSYIPTSVVISVNLKFRYYPAATYFLGGNIRLIDLTDKRLIANFNYPGSEWTIGNSDDIVRLFIRDFSKEIGM